MLKWVRKCFSRRSRGMNLTKQGPDPGPGPLTKKAPPEDFRINGQGPHPLSYPSEPPDDENMNEIMEEMVDVVVYLPDGKSKQVSVNSNIPMMDLLVNLAAGSRLNPAGHTLQVVNEETGKLKEYKANQTIGSLCTRREDHKFHYVTVQIVPKKDSKKYTGNHRNAQPFEMTKRFTVNLPGGQKKVLRISPQSTLEQVLAQLSHERQVDSSRVLFQLPSNPQQKLSPQTRICELPASEINLVSANVMLDGAKSMPDLSVGRSQSMKNENSTPYMPMAGEGKKKKGFFSFLKKEKKFTVSMQADLNHAGKSRSSSKSRKEGGSPPITRRKVEGTERPKSMFVTSTSEVNGPKSMSVSSSEMDVRTSSGPSIQVKSAPALNSVKEAPAAGPPVKSGKKKRAPPPPSQAKAPPNTNVVTAEITVESKQTTPVQAESRIPEIAASNQLAQKFHSRNSSDSSGYHELTLSGAESPDTAKIEENLELKINNKDMATSSERNKNSMDSGVQDMASPRRKVRPGIDNLETGSSQTLPLDKVGKKEMSRTRSLERPAGAKKKKAPPPPPGQGPPCEPLSVSVKATIPKPARKSSDSTPIPAATSSPRPTANQKKDETVAIHAVLDDLDTHLGEDDIENEVEGQEDQMMMVENGDLTVEDVDQPRTARPCAFVAPPPPDEPPPEDVEIVKYSDIMGIKVDTVDIGTETSDDSASFDQGSPKSSPNEEEYKNEMANFVERMNKEVVKQNIPDETEANQKEPDSERQQKISVQVVKLDLQSSAESSPCLSPREKTGAEGDKEVSEITYSFTVDAVPPEFMENEGVKGQKGQEEEDEEEEYTESITEVIYHPSSSSDGFGSPRQIPDLDSPKEHVKRLVSNEKSEEAVKVEAPIQNQETAVQVQVTEVEKPKEVKNEKEEFVLTFDDLQNVDFTGPKKKKPQSLSLKTESKAPKEEVKRRSGRKSPASVTSPVLVLEELRSRFRSDGEENVLITPLKESRSNGSIKERCNELSFTPSSEGEQEHVMEEKSISFMAHPVVRSSQPKEVIVVEKLDLSKDVTDGLSQSENIANNNINEDSVNNNETDLSSARDSSNDNDSAPNSARDSVNNNSAPSSARGSVSSIDMGPVEQMQQQIQVWQQQLEQNQNLLASQPVPTDENSIQLQSQLRAQIDIQKQMLAQMQKSMETLAAQSQTKPQDSPRNSVDGKTETSPPPPAPSPPVLPQMRMKSNSIDKEKKPKKKSSKKFEPKLDPREELMLQIRGFQGREGLKKVPLKKTKWVSGPGVSQ